MSYSRITVASTRAAIEATGYALVRQTFLDHEHRHGCAAGLHWLAIGKSAYCEIPVEYIGGIYDGFEGWNRLVFGPPDYQVGYRDGVMIREALKPPFYEEWLSAEEPRPVSGEHEADRPCACSCRTWEEFPSPLQQEIAR